MALAFSDLPLPISFAFCSPVRFCYYAFSVKVLIWTTYNTTLTFERYVDFFTISKPLVQQFALTAHSVKQ